MITGELVMKIQRPLLQILALISTLGTAFAQPSGSFSTVTLTGSNQIVFYTENNATWQGKNNAGGYEWFLCPRYTDNATYMNYGSAGLYLRNNAGVSTMHFTNNNMVGIGKNNPSEKLDIAGGNMVLDNARYIMGRSFDGVAKRSMIGMTNSNKLDVGQSIFVTATGQVGLGTSTMGTSLVTVGGSMETTAQIKAGSLKATGLVEAGSIKSTGVVEAGSLKIKDWTMEVPDYVFENDYRLGTLAETEEFVKANKHLPGIPSAKEMKKDGMDMAEMNLRLLKKVEELTLHMIEQDKKIRGLEARVR